MGVMTFRLPASVDPGLVPDLERAYVIGGPDSMPWPTEARIEDGFLLVERRTDESGFLVLPWEIPGAGRLMGSSATLMERPAPYDLLTEMARGKVNQLRSQTEDWRAGGLQVSADLSRLIHEASLTFGRAVTQPPSDLAAQQARSALVLACETAEQLVQTYVDQVFHLRHQRQPRLDTGLGVRLGDVVPEGPAAAALRETFNTVSLNLSWHRVEAAEGQYLFDRHDAVLAWAQSVSLPVTAGPLVDFSSACFPDWLWTHERNLTNLATFMCRFVERAVRRYRNRIRRWHVSSASNCATLLGLQEEELLWLTMRLAEAARQVDPGLELVIGIAQPWGEYMAVREHMHSPFIFADTLIRNSINLAALEVELIMGVTPRGSYVRDRLETSRLLDLYSLLGVPLRVALGYPSAEGPDAAADPELRVAAGRWRDGFGPERQAHWAEAFAGLTLAKPYMQAVQWAHFSDVHPHQVPHAGLVDAGGNLKPALERLRQLREAHLS